MSLLIRTQKIGYWEDCRIVSSEYLDSAKSAFLGHNPGTENRRLDPYSPTHP
jgi:hypothetical protein